MDRLPEVKTEGSERQNSKPISLVKDEHIDAMMAKRALKDLKVTNPVVRVANGEQALEYLTARGNEKPCLILRDLNMPKRNGFEFLKIIKADEPLESISVVVLTASGEEDALYGFELGTAGYIIKPFEYEKFVDV